jgi:hypothetical protein
MNERTRIQRKREKATALPSFQSETFQGDPAGQEQTVNEVPSIVQEVLSSTGQALDAETREFMEPRFGHDFSQVRVHTDERAAAAAQSVSAQAYTAGNDIVFNTGQYTPQTYEGKYLLAHELAHVVQQSPGVTPEGTTGDFAVSDPTSLHEQEAEQVAQTIMHQVVQELALPAQLHTNAPDSIYRRFEKKDMPQWGSAPSATSDSNMWFNPHAELYINNQLAQVSWFTGPIPTLTEFTASPGSSGVLHVVVDMGWFQDNLLFNNQGKANYIIDIHFTVTPEGVVQWGAQVPNLTTEGESAGLVQPVPVTATVTPTGGSVIVSPTIRGAGSSSTNVGLTGGVSAGEDVKGSGGVSSGYSSTISNEFSWQHSYEIDLTIPKPTLAQPSQTLYTTDTHFQPGSAKPEEGNERHILSWYRELPPEIQRSIESGGTEIQLRGYASTTQPGPANRKLAEERVRVVQAILQDFVGSHARFNTFAFGEYEAGTPDNVEEITERRVQITVITTDQQTSGTVPRENLGR